MTVKDRRVKSFGTGYAYKAGKLTAISGEHSATYGDICQAVKDGKLVRIRDHGAIVAFQGCSKRTVNAAYRKFCDVVRVPAKVSMEWPGTFTEF